jgi:hypothetical protein
MNLRSHCTPKRLDDLLVSFPRKRESSGFAAKDTGSPLSRGRHGRLLRTVFLRLLNIFANQVGRGRNGTADGTIGTEIDTGEKNR